MTHGAAAFLIRFEAHDGRPPAIALWPQTYATRAEAEGAALGWAMFAKPVVHQVFLPIGDAP